MRTKQEMFDLILGVANEDERVRAVYMNGSRTNSNAPKDIFQDYDIVYVVRETLSFRRNPNWIDIFGNRLYMQYPEESGEIMGHDSDVENCYGWLIQFSDGNRLDLHVQTISFAKEEIIKDKLCRILLDKDNLLPQIPDATDEDYFIKKPTQALFSYCCNEFWWCLNNVAKGLWRNEIPYVMDMINYVVRPQLISLLTWKVGIQNDFSCSVGKGGKYLNKYLSKEVWKEFIKTYSSGEIDELWNSVFIMCDLFKRIAIEVSISMEYDYNQAEGDASLMFLKNAHALPKDAKEVL